MASPKKRSKKRPAPVRQQQSQSFSAQRKNSSPVGPPRLDPYRRLISRLYEAILLLNALGQTRGDYTPAPYSSGQAQPARRRLLRCLSYICDFEKGGNTCTAIGLENTHHCYNFWIASNAGAADKVVPFLQDVLQRLSTFRSLPSLERRPKEAELVTICIRFASRRVKQEAKLLSRKIGDCKRCIGQSSTEEGPELLQWLDRFLGLEDAALCELAFEQRHSHFMAKLKDSGTGCTHVKSSKRTLGAAFAEIHHYIGRLAHHVSVPKRLVEAAVSLEHLFSSYMVCLVPRLSSVSKPEPDGHTTLEGILNRMLAPTELQCPEDLARLRDNLDQMNKAYCVMDRIRQRYRDATFVPQVHAEIQVLEHFYSQSLRYEDDDRYIGCSKPACQCCYLYMRYHPARVVLPESHHKVWDKWSPPLLPCGIENPRFIEQRCLLQKIIGELREDAKQQIRMRGKLLWHPDSTTGISKSDDLGHPCHSTEDDTGNSTDVDSLSDSSSFELGLDDSLDTGACPPSSGQKTLASGDAEDSDESDRDPDEFGGVVLED